MHIIFIRIHILNNTKVFHNHHDIHIDMYDTHSTWYQNKLLKLDHTTSWW